MGSTVLKTTKHPTLALKWLTHQPMWAPQWPLEKEKLNTLKILVQEQLDQGHIKPLTSSCNIPVF